MYVKTTFPANCYIKTMPLCISLILRYIPAPRLCWMNENEYEVCEGEQMSSISILLSLLLQFMENHFREIRIPLKK